MSYYKSLVSEAATNRENVEAKIGNGTVVTGIPEKGEHEHFYIDMTHGVCLSLLVGGVLAPGVFCIRKVGKNDDSTDVWRRIDDILQVRPGDIAVSIHGNRYDVVDIDKLSDAAAVDAPRMLIASRDFFDPDHCEVGMDNSHFAYALRRKPEQRLYVDDCDNLWIPYTTPADGNRHPEQNGWFKLASNGTGLTRYWHDSDIPGHTAKHPAKIVRADAL